MARDEAYRHAEQKIEKTRQSGATRLDLSYGNSQKASKLTEFPESLGHLPQLQSLDLSGHRLTALPESLANLTQLQSLDLSSNRLTALPEWLGHLTHLETLNLSSNRLTALPEWLGRLTHLESLNLSSNRLKALPEWLRRLTLLQSFDLADNELTALPEWLGRLTRLKSLGLPRNRLMAPPEWIGHLTQLQSLDLSGKQLTSLPKWLNRLTLLQSLDLSYNQLQSLPESLGGLTLLESLNLSHNQLKSLPESLGELTRLTSLKIEKNQLTTLPISIGNLKCIERFDFYGNNLTTVEALPDAEIILIGASEGGNPLAELPKCIQGLRRLKILTAWHCQLTALPDWLGRVKQLEAINLQANDIEELPVSLLELNSWNSLRLDDNPLNPELAAAYKEGIGAVKSYLREMAKGGKCRYEAKLLILGDGNEGKTCVSRALRGQPFRKQNSTRGVDVEQWNVPHPDDEANREKGITLNVWDFEGRRSAIRRTNSFLRLKRYICWCSSAGICSSLTVRSTGWTQSERALRKPK